jgi:hypothetical protein
VGLDSHLINAWYIQTRTIRLLFIRYAASISQHTLARLLQLAVGPGLAAVGGPVEHAGTLCVVRRDVGDGAPGGLEEVGDGAVEEGCAVAVLRGGDAGEAVAEEAGGAEAAEAVGVADGGVGVLVGAGDVREAGGVALPGGAACLVAAVVVVVLLEPVQGASPGDARGGVLCFVGRVNSLCVRVVPGPLLLDVGEPGAHVCRCQGCARRFTVGTQGSAAQRERAVLVDSESQAVPGDVVVVERYGAPTAPGRRLAGRGTPCMRRVPEAMLLYAGGAHLGTRRSRLPARARRRGRCSAPCLSRQAGGLERRARRGPVALGRTACRALA